MTFFPQLIIYEKLPFSPLIVVAQMLTQKLSFFIYTHRIYDDDDNNNNKKISV